MSTVEEPDDTGVEVPNLVWPIRSDAKLRLRRVNSLAWASPAMASNQSVPRRGRGEDFAKALREDSKSASGDVSVLVRAHNVPDALTRLGGELLRSRLRTRRNVVKCALLVASPGVESRRREAEDAERCPQRNGRSRAVHGAENSTLFDSVDKAASGERDVAHSQQNDNQAQCGDELGVACSESDDLLLQRALGHRRDVKSDDTSYR